MQGDLYRRSSLSTAWASISIASKPYVTPNGVDVDMCKLFMGRRSLDHLVPHRRYGGPVMVNLCQIITGLAFVLFFNHTFIPRTDARSMTFIDGETQTQGSEQASSHDRNPLPALQTNSSETRAQADSIACKKAEQLYKAAAEDARTLERAIFISAFRREVERALSRRMTDEELRTLADEARTEAHRWYKFIQSDPRCAASWHGELNSRSSDREASWR